MSKEGDKSGAPRGPSYPCDGLCCACALRGSTEFSAAFDADDPCCQGCLDEMAAPDRVKVACINWSYPDAPHALIYVLRDGEAVADQFTSTWVEAMALVPRYARAINRNNERTDDGAQR